MSEGVKADLQKSGVGQLFGDAFALNIENGTHVISEEKYAVRGFRNVIQHFNCLQRKRQHPGQASLFRFYSSARETK